MKQGGPLPLPPSLSPLFNLRYVTVTVHKTVYSLELHLVREKQSDLELVANTHADECEGR